MRPSEPKTNGSRSGSLLLALLCALLAGFAPLHRLILNPGLAILERDQLLIWTPVKAFLARALREEGAIPLWNHLSEAGMPFWADINSSPLFPLNFVFLLFSSPTAGMTAYLFLLLALSYLGGFLLFRTLRVSPGLARLAAFALPWTGVSLSSLNFIHSLSGHALAPWYLAFLLRWVRRGRAADAVLASLFLALPVYGGEPQTSYVLSWITLGLVAWHCAERRVLDWRKILGAGGIGLGALACSAAQLLPTVDMAIQRTGGLRLILESEALFWSTHPWRLIELLVPHFWGSPVPESSQFWGVHITEQNQLYLNTLFLGSLAGFSLLTLFPLRGNRRRRRRRTALLLAVILGFLVSFGENSPLPLYEWLFYRLPGWNLFRYPERTVFWPILGLIVLSGLNLRRLFWILPRLSWKRALLLGAAPTGVALAGWLFWKLSVPAAKLVAVPGLAAWLAFFLARALLQSGRRSQALLLIGSCLFLEASLHSHRIFHVERAEILRRENLPMVEKILAALAREPDDGRARRVHNMNDLYSLSLERLKEHLQENELRNHMAAMGLSGNTSLLWGVARVSSYNAVTPTRRVRFWLNLSQRDPIQLLSLLSVRVIYSLDRVKKDKPGEYLFILNNRALPELHFPETLTMVSEESAALARLRDMDPAKEAVILAGAEPPELWRGSAAPKPEILHLRRHGRGLSAQLRASHPSPARTLLWNASWDRNWRAYLDGQPLLTAQANGWAVGVRLPILSPQNPAQLEIRYESPWIRAGALVSCLWFLASCLLLIRSYLCPKTSPRGEK